MAVTKEIRLFFGKVALAIANPLVRRAMGDHFRHRGAEDVFHLDDFKSLYETLKQTSIGMLVTDDTLSDRPTAPLVHDIRNGVLHEHPFPLVIMLAHQKGEQHLRSLINCGPDAIVLAPVSITDLFSKIDRFAAGRKPFIIAHDYIGPDRRSAPREGSNQPLIIEPPNPLTEGADPESFQRAIEASTEALKAAQVECSMGQLAWALKSGNSNDFTGLIVALELLIKSTAQIDLQEAASGMIGAIRGKDMKSVLAWSQKLIAAKKKPS
jgi:DNA-binding NarL/FixJ family response regulator